MKNLFEKLGTKVPWQITGDFTESDAIVEQQENTIVQKTESYEIRAQYEVDENGVYVYTGKIKNITDKKITLNCLKTRFMLHTDDISVYTQYNGWQNESTGRWQPLVTGVLAKESGIRTACGSAPFLSIWSEQEKRGVAIHLLPQFAWEMSANYITAGEARAVEILVGVNCENFNYAINSGESLDIPHIIFYQFINKTDMDCYKLHNYFNSRYHKKQVPVMYNTWLYSFDNINYENISCQIDKAAYVGCEYFVIDAGWFGKGGDWFLCRGDWKENCTRALCGNMDKIADSVRSAGMKFGLWFEIESASEQSDIVKAHPEYFFKSNGCFFLDFTNKDACSHISTVLGENIEKYKIELIKFDFNQDSWEDKTGAEFINYFLGYNKFIKEIKKVYPDIYLESCASGGMRMDLSNVEDFDSFWLSDDQSAYEGIRIFKDTILRMPPQWIEKWAVVSSFNNYVSTYGTHNFEKIISTHDAVWNNVVGVQESFLNGFLTGGPLGLSFDLNAVSDSVIDKIKSHIEEFKKNRIFWDKCECRILTDTKHVLALQFSDSKLTTIKIIVFSYKLRQENIYVYPTVDLKRKYKVGKDVIEGAKISENGFELKNNGNYMAEIIEFEERLDK